MRGRTTGTRIGPAIATALALAVTGCGTARPDQPAEPSSAAVRVEVIDMVLRMPASSRRRFLETLTDGMRELPSGAATPQTIARQLDHTATATEATTTTRTYRDGVATRIPTASTAGPSPRPPATIEVTPRIGRDGATRLKATIVERDGTTASGTSVATTVEGTLTLDSTRRIAIVSPDFATAMSTTGDVAYHVTTFATPRDATPRDTAARTAAAPKERATAAAEGPIAAAGGRPSVKPTLARTVSRRPAAAPREIERNADGPKPSLDGAARSLFD